MLKHTPGHTSPEVVFIGAALATRPGGTQKEIVSPEVEDVPIELEDDTFHVVCPTCYDFVPRIRYSSHRHSRGCHLPARPPEDTLGGPSCETYYQTPGRDPHEQSKSTGKYIPAQKNKWTHDTSSPMATKIKQRDARPLIGAADDRMTAIYRAALRKPNVDGTYNVNGQVTSLQELKRQIWNLPRQIKTNI